MALSKLSGVLQCLALCFLFVGSVRICRQWASAKLSRNHPRQILTRMFGLLLVCSVAWIPIWWEMTKADADCKVAEVFVYMGIPQKLDGALLRSVLTSSGLSVLLLLGACIDELSKLKSVRLGSLFHLESIRDVLIAPLQEEFCFRACMCSLLKLSDMGRFPVMLVTSILFGLSHTHHALDLVLADGSRRHSSSNRGESGSSMMTTTTTRRRIELAKLVLRQSWLQVSFTTVFGLFASFLFLNSGSLASSISAHMLCNLIGPPDFSKLVHSPGQQIGKGDARYKLFTCLGLCGFCVSFTLLVLT